MTVALMLLTLVALAPQGDGDQDHQYPSALSKIEQRKLNKAAIKWFDAWKTWDAAEESQDRLRLNQPVALAKKRFMKEWDSKESENPLAHHGDLVAIFADVFPYDRQSGTGLVKQLPGTDGKPYSVVIPKGYRHTQSYPCVLLVPGFDPDAKLEAKAHFGATWKNSDFADEALFVIPSANVEFDPQVDLSTDSGDSIERGRIAAVLSAAGDGQRLLNLDRNRLLLDCGKGASGFGLRLATYFPTRFAGVILRHPVVQDDVRLDSLTGMPVLLVSNEETKAAATEIAAKLNALAAGSCQVVDASAEGAAGEIEKFAMNARRDLFPKKVTLAPNHDQFNSAYWVTIGVAEPVHSGLPADQLPIITAEADHDANRISVTTRGITNFSLLLNDLLVDLDKEFTVVINGKAITTTRNRSFHDMTTWLFKRYDPNYIFTTRFTSAVPKADASSGENRGGGH